MKILYVTGGQQKGKSRFMEEFANAAEAAGHTVVRQRVNGGPRYCEERDHKYDAGPYSVCRRCGGEWRQPERK